MKIYTDGSFIPKYSDIVGYSAVFILEELKTDYRVSILYGGIKDKEYAKMRNVSGEIFAVMNGINYCIENSLDSYIRIYHDYSGVGHWANETWKRNKELTIQYHDFIKDIRRNSSVDFLQVNAHTGVVLNELADKFAKRGILLANEKNTTSCAVIQNILVDKYS